MNTDGSVQSVPRKALQRGSLIVLVLAVAAYILLALAQQGGIGSQLNPVPQSPLPFNRSAVIGVDLSDRSSIGALEWIDAADVTQAGLISVPVDGEIVAAITEETTREEAIRALDSLLTSTGDVPLAVCLRQPISSFSNQELAEASISVLQENFTNQVAYVYGCDAKQRPQWHETLALEITGESSGGQLIPLTVGEPVTMLDIENPNDLRRSHLRAFSGNSYNLLRFKADQPLDPGFQSLATNAIADAAQIALILVQPDQGLDPVTFSRSLTGFALATNSLPEGFTNIYTPQVSFVQGFTSSTVGTVEYFRTDQQGQVIGVDFVGTALYAIALQTPEGGSMSVWLDIPDEAETAIPDGFVDLSASQASDAAIPLVTDLPAARHTVVLQTEGGEIAVAGFFVSGRPESRWNGGLSAISLLVIAALAMASYSHLRIHEIRESYFAPALDRKHPGHPRDFSRES